MRAASRAGSDRTPPYVCNYFQMDNDGWSPSVFQNTYASSEDAIEGERCYSSGDDNCLIQDGVVKASGTHDELVAQSEDYKSLFSSQFVDAGPS